MIMMMMTMVVVVMFIVVDLGFPFIEHLVAYDVFNFVLLQLTNRCSQIYI